MASLEGQIEQLYTDLGNYAETQGAGAQAIAIFNALLAAAKEAHPDDPVLSAMSEVDSRMSAAQLRVLAGQIRAAVAS
jgi:hypothetical protein